MDRRLMLMENFSPWGGLPLPRGYIHVYFHNNETSSPLKPLGQSKPNFIWSILGRGERKFTDINGQGHMTKMAAMAINRKKPLKIFFSRTRRPMILKLGVKHQ